MKKIEVAHKLMIMALPLALMAGCGSGGKAQAPIGSSITINPSSVSWLVTVPPATTTACAAGQQYFYHELNISVLGPNGKPINNAQIYVTLDLTLETSSSDTQRLYDDPTWVQADPPLKVPTGRVAGSYVTSTGDYGNKKLVVAVQACTHAGNLNISSGPAFGTMHIDVK